jgi:hypothetical protein
MATSIQPMIITAAFLEHAAERRAHVYAHAKRAVHSCGARDLNPGPPEGTGTSRARSNRRTTMSPNTGAYPEHPAELRETTDRVN